MASPVGGMQLDPKLMMLLQQHPELLQALGGGGGMPPGGMPPPGGGMPGLGGTPPLGMPPGGPPPAMPGSGMPGANSVPGLTPMPPAPGGQSQFGPPPGAPQLPPPPSGGMAPPPSPGGPPGMNPQLAAVNMTLGQAAYGGPERALDRQTKLADELRSEAAPGLRGNGRVQTAANPLEFAATAYNRIGGQAMSDRTEEKRQALFEERMRKLRGDMGLQD